MWSDLTSNWIAGQVGKSSPVLVFLVGPSLDVVDYCDYVTTRKWPFRQLKNPNPQPKNPKPQTTNTMFEMDIFSWVKVFLIRLSKLECSLSLPTAKLRPWLRFVSATHSCSVQTIPCSARREGSLLVQSTTRSVLFDISQLLCISTQTTLTLCV